MIKQNRRKFAHEILALVCIGAVVLERVKKNDEKMFLIARILAAAGLVIGMANAFFV